MEPTPPCAGRQSLSRWPSREVPGMQETDFKSIVGESSVFLGQDCRKGERKRRGQVMPPRDRSPPEASAAPELGQQEDPRGIPRGVRDPPTRDVQSSGTALHRALLSRTWLLPRPRRLGNAVSTVTPHQGAEGGRRPGTGGGAHITPGVAGSVKQAVTVQGYFRVRRLGGRLTGRQ